MTTLRSAQLIVSESLYDSLGRPAITTVPVAKQNDSSTTNNASQIGFITDFIKNRNPQDSDSMWVNGGKLAGSITSWVDPISFSLKEDPEYAYQGTYYETDPTSRTLQSSKPGVIFKKSADFSNPGYSDSYYANYFPEALYDVLPPSSIQIPNASGENSSFTSPNSFPYMPISAQQTSLGNLGLVTQASWKDNAGRMQAKATVDSNNNYILKSLSYQTGTGMSDGLPSNSTSKAPIMDQEQIYLPNFFDFTVSNSTSFYIKKQSNVLGQIVQTESPDQGTNVLFTDIFGRLRYSQTADQLAASMIQYYLYDALNRIIEVGVYPGSWNVSSFQENTLTLETSQPAQAQIQKSITYDQLSTNSFDAHDLGKIVQTTTYTIGNSVAPGAYVNETYGYDSWGRIKKIIQEVTTNGNSNTFTATSNTTRYAYNGFSNVLQITYPSNFGVNYTYNIQGLVSEVSYTSNVHGGTVYSLGFYTYNAYNQITSEVLFDGNASTNIVTTGYTYGNSLNQLTAIQTLLFASANPPDISTLFSETLCYTDDPTGNNKQGSYQDGNIQRTSYNYGSMSDYDHTITYTYDAFGRLYGAGVTPSEWEPMVDFGSTDEYTSFDANGNYLLDMTYIAGTNQVNQASIPEERNPAYNSASYSYTASGLINSITYDSTNNSNPTYTLSLLSDLITNRPLQIKLSNDSQTADSFLYDSEGERIQKVQETDNGTVVITYVRGQGAKVLAEYDSNNALQNYYIQGPMGLMSIYNPTTQQNSFIIRDHLGSTRIAYNASTNQVTSYYGYDCFGNIFIADDTNVGPRYLYTGQEWDQELGLYNYHARQYDPLYTKRFLSPDPAHQFPNSYTYCANNPVNYLDFDGKMMRTSSSSGSSSGGSMNRGSIYYRLDNTSIELIRALTPTRDPKGGGLTGLYNRETGTLIVRNYAPVLRTGGTYQNENEVDANNKALLRQTAIRGEGSAHEVMASDLYFHSALDNSQPAVRFLDAERGSNPWGEHFDYPEIRGWSILRLEDDTANPGGRNLVVRFGSNQLNFERNDTTRRFIGEEDRIGIMSALRNQGGFRNIMYSFEPFVQDGMNVTTRERSFINGLRL